MEYITKLKPLNLPSVKIRKVSGDDSSEKELESSVQPTSTLTITPAKSQTLTGEEVKPSSTFVPFDPRVQFDSEEDKQSARHIWTTDGVNLAIESSAKGYPLRSSPFYKNNTLLRTSGLNYLYLKSERLEILKCKLDVIYFAEQYCKLMTTTGRRRSIQLRDYQKRLLISFQKNKYNIVLTGRQVGKTTTTAIFLLWLICFHPEITVALLGDKQGTATENLDKIKEIYYALPFFLKPGVYAWNVRTIVLDTKSKIITGPCKKSALVGKTVNVVYIDELAIPLAHQSKEVVEYAVPTIASMTEGVSKIIFSSTPSGDNIFKDLWVKAVLGINKFVPLKVPWWEVPGRDLQWKAEQIATFGQDFFDEQFNCMFLSSSATIYNQNTIEQIERGLSNYRKIVDDVDDQDLLKVQWRIIDETAASVEQEPIEFLQLREDLSLTDLADMHIVCQIDLAEGLDGEHDYTVANFFQLKRRKNRRVTKTETKIQSQYQAEFDDFNENSDFSDEVYSTEDVYLEQIALFHSNVISIPAFTMFMRILCTKLMRPDWYRLVPEMNKYGSYFCKMLMSDRFAEYEMETECLGTTMFGNKEAIGVTMSSRTKSLYVRDSKPMLESQTIKINESTTLEEGKHFGKVKNSYAGLEGFDDIWMTIIGLSAYANSENPNWQIFCEIFNEDKDEVEEDGGYIPGSGYGRRRSADDQAW